MTVPAKKEIKVFGKEFEGTPFSKGVPSIIIIYFLIYPTQRGCLFLSVLLDLAE